MLLSHNEKQFLPVLVKMVEGGCVCLLVLKQVWQEVVHHSCKTATHPSMKLPEVEC